MIKSYVLFPNEFFISWCYSSLNRSTLYCHAGSENIRLTIVWNCRTNTLT